MFFARDAILTVTTPPPSPLPTPLRSRQRHEWWGFCGETVGFTLAHCAAWKNKPLCLAEILKAEGVDPNLAAVPSSKRSENVTPLVIARRQGHATCVSVLTGEPSTTAVSWKMAFNAIRDEPDETARAKLQCFLEQGADSANQHVDSKMLDSFGEHAGFTLAHLAAAKAKLQCFALLNDFGADMTIKELSGKTPMTVATGVFRPETRPPPAPATWQQAFTAVRDADENKALVVVSAFVHGGGGTDSLGRDLHSSITSGPDSGRTLASVAADRGFRRVLHVLAQHTSSSPPAPAPRPMTQSAQRLQPTSAFRADWRRRRPSIHT